MNNHVLSIDIERMGFITATVVCNAADDALCRNTPECDCETWGQVGRDDYGWFHRNDSGFLHRHTKPDDCNICEWMNADDPVECMAGTAARSIHVADLPITPSWTGEYYEWGLASD